jgi:integrase
MKKAKRARKASNGMGRLFKLHAGRQYPPEWTGQAPFYLAMRVDGQRIVQGLKTTDGKPIYDRDQAEQERLRLVGPMMSGDKVSILKAIQARVADAEAAHMQAVDEATPPLRITDAWQAYIHAPERPDSGAGTLRNYSIQWSRFERWIASAHPKMQYLREVTTATAADYVADLTGDGLSGNTFNKHVGFLRLLFRCLSDSARITTNPFDKIKRKMQRQHSRRELTMSELTSILDAAEGHMSLLLYIGAATGLRLGDCCTLTWGDVDLMRGIIRRLPNKTAKTGKPVVVGIPPALHDRLSAIPEKRRSGYVLPAIAERYLRDVAKITDMIKDHLLDCGIDAHAPGTGSRIKRDENGLPLRDEDRKVITEATGKPAVVEVGFHSLRHTWVSMHAAAGTPGAVIQASVGHSNPAMTAHYTHVSEVTARDVAKALPAFAGHTTPTRQPLPPWAVTIIQNMTTETMQADKAELLKGAI